MKTETQLNCALSEADVKTWYYENKEKLHDSNIDPNSDEISSLRLIGYKYHQQPETDAQYAFWEGIKYGLTWALDKEEYIHEFIEGDF